MLAVYATEPNAEDPLASLEVGERPDPVATEGWTTVQVRTAALNHHDLFTLRGVGLTPDKFPMIMGCDAAGIDLSTGEEVVVHAVIPGGGWTGDETLDPRRTLLSELHQGTLAEQVLVPKANVVPKPADLSWAEAGCVSTAWLTAYRMLFVRSGLRPGQTVLVQGATGGVASAAITMARAAGYQVWCTARTEAKQQAGLDLGAHQAFASGARLPGKVDVVLETVGAATWAHSVRSLRPGGRIVISGATTGFAPPAELNRIFFLQLEVVGSTMGTKQELSDMLAFMQASGVRPRIDREIPMADAREGFAAMESGDMVGKIVLTASTG